MEILEVVLKDLPIKILLGVDSYKQNRNGKDTAFPCKPLLCNALRKNCCKIGSEHIFGRARFVNALSTIATGYTWKYLRLC